MKWIFYLAKCAGILSLTRERNSANKKNLLGGAVFSTLMISNTSEKGRKSLIYTVSLNDNIPSCISCLQADQKDIVELVLLLSSFLFLHNIIVFSHSSASSPSSLNSYTFEPTCASGLDFCLSHKDILVVVCSNKAEKDWHSSEVRGEGLNPQPQTTRISHRIGGWLQR